MSHINVWTQIKVYPTRIEKEVNPGDVSTNYFYVRNTGPGEIRIIMNYKDWFRLKENRFISVSDYLLVDPLQFSMGPKETKRVQCISSVPKNAQGELVSMIYFNYKEKVNSIFQTRYGVSQYLAIKNTIVKQGEINNIEVLKYKKDSRICYQFNIEIENKGNIHLRPSGHINIINSNNNLIDTVHLKEGWPVFPYHKYKYNCIWIPDYVKPGQYYGKLNIEKLSINGSKQKDFTFIINTDRSIQLINNR